MVFRLLLLGGSGQLGQSLLRLAKAVGWQVWAPGRQELDIADAAGLARQISDFCPHAIINAAAYTEA